MVLFYLCKDNFFKKTAYFIFFCFCVSKHHQGFACVDIEPSPFQSADYIEPNLNIVKPLFRLIMSQYGENLLTGDQLLNNNEKAQYYQIVKTLFVKNNIPINNFTPPDEISNMDKTGICYSNSEMNAGDFLRAVLVDTKSKSHAADLGLIRYKIFDLCNGVNVEEIFEDIRTNSLKLNQKDELFYSKYLLSLANFYRNKYQDSLNLFEDLVNNINTPPWVKETSLFMIGRNHIVLAQLKWNGFDSPSSDTIDETHLQQAKETFKRYLSLYPNGLYKNVIIGRERQIAYLSQDTEKLSQLVKTELNNELNHKKTVDNILNEFFRYHDSEHIDFEKDNPLLISYFILFFPKNYLIYYDSIEKVKLRFEIYPGLYDYLHAYLLFKQKKYDLVLEQTKTASVENNTLSVSLSVLRIRSLQMLKRDDERLELLKKLNAVHKNDRFELEIANIYVNRGDFYGMINDKSIENLRIKTDYLVFLASTDDLEKLLTKNLSNEMRTLVEQELFKQYFLSGEMNSLVNLYNKVSDPGIYQKIKPFILNIFQNKNKGESYLNLGLFINDNKMSRYSVTLKEHKVDVFLDLSTLPEFCTTCEKKMITKMTAYDFFLESEAEFNKTGEKNENEAKLLSHMVKCFKGGESQTACQQNKEFENKGQFWFRRLHKLYPQSAWSKQAKYYY